MKQLIVLFLLLFGVFLGTWIYKIETPVNRPDEYAEGTQENAGAWWENGKIEVDDDWKLDPEIPLNYVPVPGEEELYMIIDNDGKIINYRKRTKQIDGSWKWEDVNPDIPDNYEPVPELKDVYKVTGEDGSVKYYKYVRNDDDTFAFVEVDKEGNPVSKNKDATTIDSKHVHITGNIYSELNNHGVVIGYDKRVQNEDGTFSWIPTEMPGISSVADAFTLPEQQETLDSSFLNNMQQQMAQANNEAANSPGDTVNIDINVNPGIPGQTVPGGSNSNENQNNIDITPETPTIINNSDGTHTEIETVRETKNEGGFTKTYETTVRKTYDADGNLLSTKSEGPFEVDSTQNIIQETEPVQSHGNKEATLNGEIARVTGNYTYKTEIADKVFATLNAQRSKTGIPALTLSDEAVQIAKLRAADMAGYDTADEKLPTYGSIGSMIADYKVVSSAPGENIWKSTIRSADEIHTRLQTLDSSRETRMSTAVKKYGCAIVERNGYYYICEVFL